MAANDDDTEARRREARRAFVRRAHPDVGGDPEVFRLGLAAIDAQADGAPTEDGAAGEPAARAGGPGATLRATAARGAGRLARDWARLPGEIRRAYRVGRDLPDDEPPGRP